MKYKYPRRFIQRLTINFVRLPFALGTSSRLLPNEDKGGEGKGGGETGDGKRKLGGGMCVKGRGGRGEGMPVYAWLSTRHTSLSDNLSAMKIYRQTCLARRLIVSTSAYIPSQQSPRLGYSSLLPHASLAPSLSSYFIGCGFPISPSTTGAAAAPFRRSLIVSGSYLTSDEYCFVIISLLRCFKHPPQDPIKLIGPNYSSAGSVSPLCLKIRSII